MNLPHPIFAIVGQNGSGKSTLIKSMLERFPNDLAVVKTVSTRPWREADDDMFYELVSEQEFEARRSSGRLTQGGHTKYDGHFYDNDRATDDRLLMSRFGICAWIESTVTLYRRQGYSVIMVRIVPDGAGYKSRSPERAAIDRAREIAGPPAEKRILNSFTPEGLELASAMLGDYLAERMAWHRGKRPR